MFATSTLFLNSQNNTNKCFLHRNYVKMFMSLGFHGVDDSQYSLLIDFPVITHS